MAPAPGTAGAAGPDGAAIAEFAATSPNLTPAATPPANAQPRAMA
ncbi:hypothetical protein ACFJIX_05130 [Roseateles sp. UC29_93]